MIRLTSIKIALLSIISASCSDSTLIGESKTVSKNAETIQIINQEEDSSADAESEKIEQTELRGYAKPENQFQESQTPEQDEGISEEEESASIPAMTTGAFLASCTWQVEGLSFACQIDHNGPTDADLNFVLKDELGNLIPTELYQIDTMIEEDGVIISVTLEADIPNWSLEGADGDGMVEVEVSNDMVLTTVETEIPVEVIEPDFSKIVVFTETNFAGDFKEYILGDYDLELGAIASIKIPGGFAVDICNTIRCVGFYGDVPDLFDFTNTAIRIRVYESEPFITVFDGTFFKGTHQTFAIATYSRNDLATGMGDDMISSFHIPAGLTAKMCEHPNGGGFCDYFTSAVAQLGAELNNDVTHIKITAEMTSMNNQ